MPKFTVRIAHLLCDPHSKIHLSDSFCITTLKRILKCIMGNVFLIYSHCCEYMTIKLEPVDYSQLLHYRCSHETIYVKRTLVGKNMQTPHTKGKVETRTPYNGEVGRQHYYRLSHRHRATNYFRKVFFHYSFLHMCNTRSRRNPTH